MIVCDANALYAAYDKDEPRHKRVVETLKTEKEQRLLSPFVLAEVDYLVLTRLGVTVEDKLLQDIENGVYDLSPMTTKDIAQARQLVNKYADLKIGLTDASIAILAARHQTSRILTFDERHFRAIRPLTNEPAFVLLSQTYT